MAGARVRGGHGGGGGIVPNPPNVARSPSLTEQPPQNESRLNPSSEAMPQEWPPLRCTPSLQAPQGPLVDFLTSGYGYDDRSVASAVKLGNEHFAKRELGRAIDFFGAAYEIGRLHFDYKPLMHDLVVRRVICYSMLGDLQQALREADLALRVVPYSGPVLLLQGLLYSKLGRADEANQKFQAAVAQCRELRDLIDGLVALFMLAQGHCDRAIQVCSQVLLRSPKAALALLVRGDAYKFHPSGYFSRQAADDYTSLLEVDLALQPLIGDRMTPEQHARFDEMVLRFHPRLAAEGPRPYEDYPMCAGYRKRRPFLVASFVAFACAKLKTCVRSTQLVQNVTARNAELLHARAAAERKVRHLVETQQRIAAMETSSFSEVWGPADPHSTHMRKYRRQWMERPLGFPKRSGSGGSGDEGGASPRTRSTSPASCGGHQCSASPGVGDGGHQRSTSLGGGGGGLDGGASLEYSADGLSSAFSPFSGTARSEPRSSPPPPWRGSGGGGAAEKSGVGGTVLGRTAAAAAPSPPLLSPAPALLYAAQPAAPDAGGRQSVNTVAQGPLPPTWQAPSEPAASPPPQPRPPSEPLARAAAAEAPAAPPLPAAELLLTSGQPGSPTHPVAQRLCEEKVYEERPPPKKLGENWTEREWLAKALELADAFADLGVGGAAPGPRSPPPPTRRSPEAPCDVKCVNEDGKVVDLVELLEKRGLCALPDWFTPLDRIYEVCDMGHFHVDPEPMSAERGIAGAPGYSYIVPRSCPRPRRPRGCHAAGGGAAAAAAAAARRSDAAGHDGDGGFGGGAGQDGGSYSVYHTVVQGPDGSSRSGEDWQQRHDAMAMERKCGPSVAPRSPGEGPALPRPR